LTGYPNGSNNNLSSAAFFQLGPRRRACWADLATTSMLPVRVFSLGGAAGGSLEDPRLMHHVVVPPVTVGHSAAFTWDSRVTIFGHEPGGGVAAECEATDDDFKKSFFLYDSEPAPSSASGRCRDRRARRRTARSITTTWCRCGTAAISW
jgi:hypothetical protein